MIRTFVALLIPEAWTEYLAGVGADLAGRMSGLSWVRRENLHMTIRFLGDLGDSGVKRAIASVEAGTAAGSAVRARIGALGGFPSLRKPRVVWIGLAEGAAEASSLASGINGALRRAGFGRPDKPFRAHLTLARVREGARGLEALSIYEPPPPPADALLDRVCVMKSDLEPSGARYTALREIRLRPPVG